VLTSPWKIGFFVALMLMTVSVGVAFLVTRSFGVVWPPLDQWGWEMVLHGSGFAFGLTPIIGVVVLAAVSAYFIITAAVRKYRRYLDSGKDYHHLIHALRKIEDLDDADQLAGLDRYGELRDFLVKLRDDAARRRADLDEREKALESAVSDAGRAREDDMQQRVKEQAQLLVTAITHARDGSLDPIDEVTLPSIKKIEEAVRGALRGAATSSRDAVAADALKRSVADAAAELEKASVAARDIERELARMADSGLPGGVNSDELRRGLDAVIGNFDTMERLASSLGTLGDDSMGIAINTALQASNGKTTAADVVQLAEDVKGLAEQFKRVAKSYQELTRDLRASLTNVEVALGDRLAGGNSYESAAIGHVADRVGKWLERSTVVTRKLRGLSGEKETASPQPDGSDDFMLSGGGSDTAGAAPIFTGPDSDRAFDARESIEFETGGGTQSIFGDTAGSSSSETPSIETLDQSASFLGEDSGEAAPEQKDFQNEERGVFDEMSTQDQMFAELGAEDSDTPTDAGEDAAAEPMDESQETTPAAADGFEEIAAGQPEPQAEAERPAPPQDQAPGAPMDEAAGEAAVDGDDAKVYDIQTDAEEIDELLNDEIMDLYALGAVDYDPAVHQN